MPGATIYYEVQGSGPVLVMIPGGPTDAGIFAGLARCLADRYTVVAYDPRGNMFLEARTMTATAVNISCGAMVD